MKPILGVLCAVVLFGCSTAPGSKLTYSKEVSRQSRADPELFIELVFSNDGVCGMDKRLYPNARERQLVSIRMLWGGGSMGMEEWTISHGSDGTAVYIVNYFPTQVGINYRVAVKN